MVLFAHFIRYLIGGDANVTQKCTSLLVTRVESRGAAWLVVEC
jgi:hypothetical protein